MSNLVNAFDFDNVRNLSISLAPSLSSETNSHKPDFSIPTIPDIMTPNKDSSGNYDDVSIYQAEYPNLPTPPYRTQITVTEMHTLSGQGFKPMRGALTEGRYLTIEANGFALTNPSTSTNQLSTTAALADHSDIHQRWVVHQLDVALDVPQFNISSAVDGKYLSQHTSLSTAVAGAEVYTVTFLGNGQGYTL
jgi:phospholipase C